MIHRNALNQIYKRLKYFDSVALLGPRQVGKTTLARAIVEELGENAIYLDLERQIDRDKIDDPAAFFF